MAELETGVRIMLKGSRRELLMMMGALPVIGSLAACDSLSRNAAGSEATPLKFWGTGTLDIGAANWRLAKEAVGVDIVFEDNGNDLGPVVAQMVSGTAATRYDLGGVQGGAEPELFQAGKILPWEVEKLSAWDDIWEWVRDIPYIRQDGKQIGIPIVVNADSIIYRESVTGIVDSYSAVFDRKFKGRSSMEDSWMNSVIFTAIYMKEQNIDGMSRIRDPGNLEVDELGTVIEFLKRHKRDGQFLKFWSGWQEGVDLITSGRVVVMTGWEPIVYAAHDRGISDVKYAVPIEGYEGWSNNLVLHSGAANNEEVMHAAHRFANWLLSGDYGCILGAMRGYMVPTDGCVSRLQAGPMSYVDTNKNGQNAAVSREQATELRDHVRRKFDDQKGRVYWQNARPKNYVLYERLWAELRII